VDDHLHLLDDHFSDSEAICFSHNIQRIVLSSDGDTVHVFNTSSGESMLVPRRHENHVPRAQATPRDCGTGEKKKREHVERSSALPKRFGGF